MGMLDIFDDDAFSVVELTATMELLPYVPSRIGRMNLFASKPAYSSTVMVEHQHGVLALLPTMPRGSENQTRNPRGYRDMRPFKVPHVPNWDSVLAEELEGKRKFGTNDQLETVSEIVNDKLAAMKQNHEVTREYHRIGALNGIVLDADGSTPIYNWFTEFGVTETEVEFNFYWTGGLDDPTVVHDMKLKCTEVKRAIQDALGAVPFTGIHCFAGDTWFDAFVTHPTVRRAFETWQSNSFARSLQNDEGGFEFCGITFENYRGSIGNVDFFPDTTARFFPTGTRDVFIEAPAPADFIDTVNTRGQLEYAKQERMKWDKGIELHTQSNVLYMCQRPAALIKGTYLNEAVGTGS